MTRTERKEMLQQVVSDRIHQTALAAWWNYQQKPTETGTFKSRR